MPLWGLAPSEAANAGVKHVHVHAPPLWMCRIA